MFQVRTTWHNAGPHTIYAKLAEKLGREPTIAELCTEIQRILNEGIRERAERGQLRHQRGRI